MDQPSPDLFFDTLFAYQRSALIKAAIELDVFTKIAEGNPTAEKIASACGASARGIRIICDCLTVCGFLTKTENEYALTESTEVFLSKHSPAYMGTTAAFLMTPELMEGFSSLAQAVRTGSTAISEEGTVSPENPVWVEFARGMMPMMMPASQMMADKLGFEPAKSFRVLDIAASHGIFGISIAKKYPNAEITALDWAIVLEVTKEHAIKFGIADRFRTIAGSAFDVEFGAGYDVVLLPNFLHHFDRANCEMLLRKIHASLSPGGRVLTLEFVPNSDRVSPPMEAMFSLVMLATTAHGDAYTFAEIETMFANAGYGGSEHFALGHSPQHLIISTK